MIKVICDVCNEEIETEAELVTFRLDGTIQRMRLDCCIPCAICLNNKIGSFVAEIKAEAEARGPYIKKPWKE